MNPPDLYIQIGQRIREARQKLGISQEALASLLALSRTSITNIEKGRQRILVHTLVDFAAALQVPPATLLPPIDVDGKDESLEVLLRGRPRKERQWIKSAIRNLSKGR